MKKAKTTKPWSGRFTKDTMEAVERFTASIAFDKRLYKYDIAGSIAHCHMLAKQGILTGEEAQRLTETLREVEREIEGGHFDFSESLEDIHTNIEARLADPDLSGGELASKLHTARSRNDQIALDMRMYVKEAILQVLQSLVKLQETIIELAQRYLGVVTPGYTHLQRAQPILFSHHLMAYFEMFQRDVERFQDCYRRTDVMPLGSGALAGLPYPIDREMVARELGFSTISRNSIDAVSDRDFVVEFLACASLAMTHLSRLAEEIVLWTTAEFGFLELDDAYATGSSIMPQKKNPDVVELVRGKTGRAYGYLMAMLTVLKGLPLAYNRDLQEDKEGLFDTADTLLSCLEVFPPMLATAKIRAERMRQAAEEGFSTATDLADYLVKKSVPFRQAHRIVGQLVAWCIKQQKSFQELTLEQYRRFSPLFEEDVLSITAETSVSSRGSIGGTSPRQVERAISDAQTIIAASRGWLEARVSKTTVLTDKALRDLGYD